MTSKLRKRLKAARHALGYTVRDIERLSHGSITNGYYSALENGRDSNLSPLKLRALCVVLKLNYLSCMMDAGYIKRSDLV